MHSVTGFLSKSAVDKEKSLPDQERLRIAAEGRVRVDFQMATGTQQSVPARSRPACAVAVPGRRCSPVNCCRLVSEIRMQ